jgi:ribonuclease BN (tRNA processing enzyme)
MRVKFLGCGDAFGSGGRFNTCILVDRRERSFLIDCGASAMVSIRRFGVDPNCIHTIVLSHLHADHFGGLPSFILDAQLVSRRQHPLVIVGPKGLSGRLHALMEAHFPGSTEVARKFQTELVEIEPERATNLEASKLDVTGFVVRHPSGTQSLALRIGCDGKTIAYTGDTEWVDALLAAGRDADLLIAEAYTYERKVRFHLDYSTLRDKLELMNPKRIVLTHMSGDMLERKIELRGCETASDGLEIELD